MELPRWKQQSFLEFLVPHFYEVEHAFAHGGLAGLLPQQRGPKEAHKLDANIMAFIENYLVENQKLPAKALADLVLTHFNISVYPRSIERALVRKKKFTAKSSD